MGDFYLRFVTPNELDVAVVKQWWKVLHDYATTLKTRELVLFVRKMEHEQRRGFVTRTQDGLRYVFSDNSLAKSIYLLARRGFAPADVNDFRECVETFRLKCMQRSNGDENAKDADGRYYSQFRKGSLPSLNGWFLAHIHSVNEAYQENYRAFEARYFIRGELPDWSYDPTLGYIVRNLDLKCSESDRKFFIAHFLRFLVPMNHFLVPLGNHMSGNPMFKDISSTEEMLSYMRQIRANVYQEAWLEFEKTTLCQVVYSDMPDTTVIGVTVEDATVGSSPAKKKISVVHTAKVSENGMPKALRKIPRWATNPDCNPYRIIRAYYISAADAPYASAAEIRRLCTDANGDPRLAVPAFNPSWRDLTHVDSSQSYGQVFVLEGDRVSIYPPVSEAMAQFREQFLA
ncbi:MAG: hypothetical protein Q4G65_13170 [bacterium]|nr:hypothetical protein [bacterium]